MQTDQYTSIHPSEIEDVEQILRDAGFEPREFEFDDNPDEPRAGGLFAVSGIVHVTRGETTRTYRTGSLSQWYINFEEDLQAGVFGSPE